MEETQSQNARLMSLLEKMAKPVESCTINLEVSGVFAFPEEWKPADEANPTLFAYKVHFQGVDITEGKINPRELTEQEKKEIEEAAMAKKKPPPKDNKKGQPEPPPLSPEELERQRILEEEKQAAEKKAREEWEALTDEERFYRTYEDQFKKDSLKFANKVGAVEKEGEDLVVFEEKVALGGAWLYFTKYANATEEEMTKMRKSKPKNLNLIDLNPCLMRAWIDLSYFQTPGVSELVYRAKVERFYNPEDKPEELPNPKLEQTYILIKITLDPPITPLITDVQPRVEDMVPKPIPIPRLPLAVEVVNEFKQQLAVIMESLAMEYSGMFAREMNQAHEAKPKLHLSAQQKRDIREQRKEKFLYDFNTTGKYNILKEKMKKSLMKIVRDKFQKSGSLTGVTADSKDQFYSELYLFLTEQMRQTLNDLIQEKKDELNEELVVSVKQANKEREVVITGITKETDADRELRLAVENEILNNLQESERAFRGLLTLERENHKNAYMFCQFLLRRKNFARAEDVLNEALRYNNENRTYITLLACLLARRGRRKEAIICLNSLLDRDPMDSFSNTLMSFIYAKLSNEPKLGRKFLAMSQRVYMRKVGLLPPKVAPHSIEGEQSPDASPKQTPQQIPDDHLSKKVVLTDDQNDEIWTEVVEYLVTNGIYDLAEQVLEEIHNKETPKVEYFRAQLVYIKGDLNASVELLNKLIEADPRNHDYLLSKANYCFEKGKYSTAEEAYIQAFKLKTTPKTFSNFLRLGYNYLYRKSWGDARAVLTKACELKPSSSLGWLGLGIACLRTDEFSEGEKALGQANIYDPVNADTWGYLALLCLHDGMRMVQAHQALREMLKCELKNTALVEEIADYLMNNGKFELAEILYKKVLDSWQGNHLILNDDIGNIHTKLAKIYYAQERLNDAKLYYSEALKYLQGETERERVEMLLADVNKAAMETGGFNNA